MKNVKRKHRWCSRICWENADIEWGGSGGTIYNYGKKIIIKISTSILLIQDNW